MSKPFDATTKELIESDPRAWLELLLGRRLDRVRTLNVDLSTITAEGDSVISVEDATPWLVHIEFQSSYDPSLPLRLQRYNILVNYRHRLPVQSVALLLCRNADGPALSGLLQQSLPDGLVYHEFRYNVVRTWERPCSEILAGGLATLPLAPLGNVKVEDLPAVIQAMQLRLEREATKSEAQTLWMATYLLMGLKYSDELIDRLLEGVQIMKESVTYQKILREGLAEGRAEEAKKILRRQGSKRFGKPDPWVDAAIDSTSDLERLEQLVDRILDVQSWDELLDEQVNGAG
ncbi:MAG: Rpn family recombination-promoting nuclease/putative transposase [Isosphaeraceae bacterium]